MYLLLSNNILANISSRLCCINPINLPMQLIKRNISHTYYKIKLLICSVPGSGKVIIVILLATPTLSIKFLQTQLIQYATSLTIFSDAMVIIEIIYKAEMSSPTNWVTAVPGKGEMPADSLRCCLNPGHCHILQWSTHVCQVKLTTKIWHVTQSERQRQSKEDKQTETNYISS